MTAATTPREHIISLRVPNQLHTAVKAIARREAETTATIWRRLVKRGLELERHDGGNEAA
jgi:hypothetical protein